MNPNPPPYDVPEYERAEPVSSASEDRTLQQSPQGHGCPTELNSGEQPVDPPPKSLPEPDLAEETELGDTIGLAPEPPAPDAPDAGRFGRFTLVRKIAAGGMGIVYEATQDYPNRRVALKMIRSNAMATDVELERFRTEVDAIALLDHPNIIPVYESGVHAGCHFFTMKLVAGQSLSYSVESMRERPREIASLMMKIARAVQHAHQRGILHRDLKPGNILMDTETEPLVADFGLAKIAANDSSLTRTSLVIGTPSYMAPEQATDERGEVTILSDVYSLGAILYELLTGRPPFKGANSYETIRQVVHEDPKPPATVFPGADRELSTIAIKCLEKEPARRYPSADALADDLERWIEGRPIVARSHTRLERAFKWVRRHPTAAVASAIGGTATLLGTLVAFYIAFRLYEASIEKSLNEKIGRVLG